MKTKPVRKAEASEDVRKAEASEDVRKAQARDGLLLFEIESADDFLDEMIPLFRAWVRRQMNDNQKAPEEPEDATIRSREATASTGLVRTLERLNALCLNREKRGKKASTLDERQLMERFIRRMDQLLAGGAKANAARKPDGR